MMTLNLTDEQYEVLRFAMINLQDIEEDTMLEEMDVLFVHDEPVVMTAEKSKVLRDGIEAAIQRRDIRRQLCALFNIELGPKGYTA